MTISTTLGRKVKRRRKVKRKAKKEKVRKRRKGGKRRKSQNTGRNPNAYDVIGIFCVFLFFVLSLKNASVILVEQGNKEEWISDSFSERF